MNGVERIEDHYTLLLDTRVYALEAIKNAAYRLADQASVLIRSRSETAVEVVFVSFRDPDHEQVIGTFLNELLDQDLRAIIKRETTHVRNLILAHAFSRTSLIKEE